MWIGDILVMILEPELDYCETDGKIFISSTEKIRELEKKNTPAPGKE